VLTRGGDRQRAATLLAESLPIFLQLGDRRSIATNLLYLAEVTDETDRIERRQALYTEALKAFQGLADREGIALTLEGLARFAADRSEGRRAAELFGAASALREATGFAVPPADRPAYDRGVGLARELLNSDAFGAAWSAGRALSPDAAVGFALDAGVLA
jgi:hypothetical protein